MFCPSIWNSTALGHQQENAMLHNLIIDYLRHRSPLTRGVVGTLGLNTLQRPTFVVKNKRDAQIYIYQHLK